MLNRKSGFEMTITSGTEGRHGERSKHYIGQAVDFRTRDLIWETPDWDYDMRSEFAEHMKKLGRDYDVVLETDHLHVEFDPK